MAYDDVLVLLGEFGRYQKRIYLLLCFPAISCALHKLAGVFLQAKAYHRCQLPDEADNASYILEPGFSRMVYPWDPAHQNRSSCFRYDANYTSDYIEAGITPNHTVKCSSWIFDHSNYQSTTLMEWDLVCDQAWLKATSDALLMTGVMIGSILFGDLSDRMGRKPIFFVSLVLQVIFGILVGVAPDVYSYMITRMIVGATTSGVFLVAYVIGMEMVGPSKRMFAGVGFQLFFTAGFLLTALFAYFIRDWRNLQIALTLPGVLFLSYWWFIPESVRWLLTKGRNEEAVGILKKAARENKKEVGMNVYDDLCTQAEADLKAEKNLTGEKPSIVHLFKYPNLRKKSFIMFFLWFVNSGTYYGLSWNTSNLGGNVYLNFVFSGMVEIPAYTILLLTLNRWGRKLILCGSMIVSGICLLLTLFVPDGMGWMTVTLAMAGKLAITASYGTVYIFTAEQFPTVIRNVGMGAASTFARVGGILAPYINIMAELWPPLPLIIFGVMALVSGVSALMLPETLNKQLPESIEDGENFGKRPKSVENGAEGEQLQTLTNSKA